MGEKGVKQEKIQLGIKDNTYNQTVFLSQNSLTIFIYNRDIPLKTSDMDEKLRSNVSEEHKKK